MTHKLVKVPLSELEAWDREHDAQGGLGGHGAIGGEKESYSGDGSPERFGVVAGEKDVEK